MTENFDHDSSEYLLNQMDAARRAAFERALQRDAAARAALKNATDDFAGFACEVTTGEPFDAAEQRLALGAILVATKPGERPPKSATFLRWPPFVWAAAAALLLGVNFVHFRRPFAPWESDSATHPPPTTAATAAGERADPGSVTPSGAADSAADASSRPIASAAESNARREETAAELARLRANVMELQEARDRIRADYDRLLGRLAEQAVVERSLNRMTTMELVDAGRFARGERRGLVNVGRDILIEPGVVTQPDAGGSPGGTTSTTRPEAYAWSVFDEKDHRGYLNLYQLPTLPAEQAMHVWVRTTDAGGYQRVAEVPAQFHGGNGTVQYVTPNSAAAPAEILITIEPKGVVPTLPTGRTVLRGP